MHQQIQPYQTGPSVLLHHQIQAHLITEMKSIHNEVKSQTVFLQTENVIYRAHSFPRTTEFQAKPKNLPVSTEFSCFHGISWKTIKRLVISVTADVMT